MPPVPKGHCRTKWGQIHSLCSSCSGNALFAKQVLGFDYKSAGRDSEFDIRNVQIFNQQILVGQNLPIR